MQGTLSGVLRSSAAEVKDVVVSEEVQALEDIELDPAVEGEPAHQDLVQRTYRPNRLKRKRTHGFLERLLSASTFVPFSVRCASPHSPQTAGECWSVVRARAGERPPPKL